jgi:predicted TIM-barrel fold metal-dependent hydrolase
MTTPEPVIVVSNDTHIGPRLMEDLRPYCPRAYLDEFDRFTADAIAESARFKGMLEGSGYLDHPNFQTLGHYESASRLADYNHDGVAAGVIFHGSTNMQPIPFVPQSFGPQVLKPDPAMAAVGQRIYNQWLVDFVSNAPQRHVGIAYLPLWDFDAAVRELRWAHENGLRGVNFPAMRDGELPEYNRRRWEPFWTACEELQMPLVTHVGGRTSARYSGLESIALIQLESANLSQRAVPWMIFGGVFERHPGLKLVITETPGNWVPAMAGELDAIRAFYAFKPNEPLNKALLEQVPRPPSEYIAHNVFLGASFASPYEVKQASQHGLGSQLLWGSDYPHLEGTFVYSEDRKVPSVTRLALRHTFCESTAPDIRRMVGENAIGVYNLDRKALQKIAKDIDAPSIDELVTPIESVPAEASVTAFRTGAGSWS